MAPSDTFEGSFDDEASSSEEASSSDEEGSSEEEESSVEDSDDEEVPQSKSGLPFEEKVNMFNNSGKVKSQDEFDDEGSEEDSEDYSEDSGSDEESYSGDSGSESEEDLEKNQGNEEFLNEQERLRGMGSIPSNDRFRRMYVIGLAVFCVVLLALAIGLGVGLSQRKKNKDKEDEGGDGEGGGLTPAPMATLPPGTAPTSPPVRMPISLPIAAGIFNPDAVVDAEVVVPASGDTTIYREGDNAGGTFGNEGTMLVQGGSVGDSELVPAFSLVELSVPLEDVRYMLEEGSESTAEFCLDHVPNEEPDRTVTYSACLIDSPLEGVEDLTGETAFFLMPDDCVDLEVVTFDVSPADTEVCMDVKDMVSSKAETALYGMRERSLEEANFVMMIDKLEPSNLAGDRFYTTNNDGGAKPPSLTIKGKEPALADCTSIADVVCSEDRLSILCSMATDARLHLLLDDPRMAFTVFAPTDEAITKVLATGVDTSDPYYVQFLLAYHVVAAAKIESSDIDCSLAEIPPMRMYNGYPTNVVCESGSIFVVGGGNVDGPKPKIIEADIKTCNGVIHVVDEVIIPGASPPVPVDPVDCDEPSFDDVLCMNSELTALCTMASMFSSDPLIGDVLNNFRSKTGTLFLPNNEAAMSLQAMDLSDTSFIADLLLLHSVQGKEIESTDLECKGELTMANGETTKTICSGNDVYQSGAGNNKSTAPKIVQADIKTCNSVIHIIDKIILPGAQSSDGGGGGGGGGDDDCQTFADLVCSTTAEDLTSLCSLVFVLESDPVGADLLESIEDAPYTFFLPGDSGLNKFVATSAMDFTDPQVVIDLLRYHSVSDSVLFAEDLKCDTVLDMTSGDSTTTECEGNKFYQVGKGNTGETRPMITQTDIVTCNGVVHVVDNVITPP